MAVDLKKIDGNLQRAFDATDQQWHVVYNGVDLGIEYVPVQVAEPQHLPPVITILTVSTSETLDEMMGSNPIAETTNKVTLRPFATGIYFNDGTADANSVPLGTDSLEIAGDASTFATLEFFAAAPTKMAVIEES